MTIVEHAKLTADSMLVVNERRLAEFGVLVGVVKTELCEPEGRPAAPHCDQVGGQQDESIGAGDVLEGVFELVHGKARRNSLANNL